MNSSNQLPAPFVYALESACVVPQIFTVSFTGVDFTLMTSHLESTRAHSVERLKQLSIAFEIMCKAVPTQHVLFGGDLNLGAKDNVREPSL